jgi:hypothetical protein
MAAATGTHGAPDVTESPPSGAGQAEASAAGPSTEAASDPLPAGAVAGDPDV